MTARGIDFTGMAYLIGLAVAGFAVYRLVQGVPSVKKALGDTAAAVGAAIDPTNPENVANRAANAITAGLTGDPSMTPGLWIENTIKKLTGAGRSQNDGDKLLAQFSVTADADDAAQGSALRRAFARNDSTFATAADIEDAELGANLIASSGAAFVDYSRLARGVLK